MDKQGRIVLILGVLVALVIVAAFAFAWPRSLAACSDGLDNDNDGWFDYFDSGCSGVADNTE